MKIEYDECGQPGNSKSLCPTCKDPLAGALQVAVLLQVHLQILAHPLRLCSDQDLRKKLPVMKTTRPTSVASGSSIFLGEAGRWSPPFSSQPLILSGFFRFPCHEDDETNLSCFRFLDLSGRGRPLVSPFLEPASQLGYDC